MPRFSERNKELCEWFSEAQELQGEMGLIPEHKMFPNSSEPWQIVRNLEGALGRFARQNTS